MQSPAPCSQEPCPTAQLGSCSPIKHPPSPCSGNPSWHCPSPLCCCVQGSAVLSKRISALLFSVPSRAVGAGGASPPHSPAALPSLAAELGVSLQIAAGLGLPGELVAELPSHAHPGSAQQCLCPASALGQHSQLAAPCRAGQGVPTPCFDLSFSSAVSFRQ